MKPFLTLPRVLRESALAEKCWKAFAPSTPRRWVSPVAGGTFCRLLALKNEVQGSQHDSSPQSCYADKPFPLFHSIFSEMPLPRALQKFVVSQVRGSQPHLPNVFPIMEQGAGSSQEQTWLGILSFIVWGNSVLFRVVYTLSNPKNALSQYFIPNKRFRKERLRMSGMGTAGLSVSVKKVKGIFRAK